MVTTTKIETVTRTTPWIRIITKFRFVIDDHYSSFAEIRDYLTTFVYSKSNPEASNSTNQNLNLNHNLESEPKPDITLHKPFCNQASYIFSNAFLQLVLNFTILKKLIYLCVKKTAQQMFLITLDLHFYPYQIY